MSEADKAALAHVDTPEVSSVRLQDGKFLQRALEALPAAFREVIILKELEEMSYREIAAVTGVPIGTVMSRLACARSLLRKELVAVYE